MSMGPDGMSTKYLRNAILPDLNLHWQFIHIWSEENEFMFGVGGDY